jgi:hypothetical protein
MKKTSRKKTKEKISAFERVKHTLTDVKTLVQRPSIRLVALDEYQSFPVQGRVNATVRFAVSDKFTTVKTPPPFVLTKDLVDVALEKLDKARGRNVRASRRNNNDQNSGDADQENSRTCPPCPFQD